MDSEMRFPPRDVVKTSDFGSGYSIEAYSSDPWTKMVKRKFNEFKEGNMLLRGSSDLSSNAKLLVENECDSLLEVLSNQKKTVKDLHLELEEERNAAASAANETMSMILRLQREKAEIQMEARQFKTFAEEKMTHDDEKLSVLDDLLCEKEQAIETLTYKVETYKDRLLSYGLTEAEMHDQILGFGRDCIDSIPCVYTSLKCSVDENPSGVEIEEKVIVGQSPCWPYYDPNSPLGTAKEIKGTFFADSPMSCSSDRVYTVDSIHVGVSEVKTDDEPSKMSKGKLNGDHWNSPRYQEPFKIQQGVNEPDMEKLYTRLQALEADRESLRQIIVSMRTDKAQLVLLKEIAQHLSKETGTTNKRNPVSKVPSFKELSVGTVFKWIVSFISWRRKAKRNKYVYELPANNMGMLMILGEGTGTRRWRCLTSSHV